MNLTPKQKTLIIDSWKAKDFDFLFKIGMLVYSDIFCINPTAKHLFPYVVECEKQNADFTNTHEFRIQALRFVQILGRAVRKVKNIDGEDDDFDLVLFHLGERHRVFAERGFRPEYWDTFEKSVVRVMAKEITENCPKIDVDDRKTAVESWKIVAHYIINGMKVGFYQDFTPHAKVEQSNAADNRDNVKEYTSEDDVIDNNVYVQQGHNISDVASCCRCCRIS